MTDRTEGWKVDDVAWTGSTSGAERSRVVAVFPGEPGQLQLHPDSWPAPSKDRALMVRADRAHRTARAALAEAIGEEEQALARLRAMLDDLPEGG